MSVLQYDTASGNPAAVLPTAGDDAAYISGRFANYEILRQDRPGAIILPIAVILPTVVQLQALKLRQIAFDFEGGDLLNNQTRQAVSVAHDAGIPCPVLYGSEDTWNGTGGLWDELAGVYKVDVDFQGWLAHPDAIEEVPAPYAAKQFLFGVEFDTSLILNPQTFYNLAAPPPPPPPEEIVAITSSQNKDGRLEVFVETTSGEVLHIAQDTAGGDWWRDKTGKPNWLSLGTPAQ